MLVGALLMSVVSLTIGLLLRGRLSTAVSRTLFGIGLGALLLGLAVIGFASGGMLRMWTAAVVALALFTVAMLLFPLSVALLWRRSHSR